MLLSRGSFPRAVSRALRASRVFSSLQASTLNRRAKSSSLSDKFVCLGGKLAGEGDPAPALGYLILIKSRQGQDYRHHQGEADGAQQEALPPDRSLAGGQEKLVHQVRGPGFLVAAGGLPGLGFLQFAAPEEQAPVLPFALPVPGPGEEPGMSSNVLQVGGQGSEEGLECPPKVVFLPEVQPVQLGQGLRHLALVGLPPEDGNKTLVVLDRMGQL